MFFRKNERERGLKEVQKWRWDVVVVVECKKVRRLINDFFSLNTHTHTQIHTFDLCHWGGKLTFRLVLKSHFSVNKIKFWHSKKFNFHYWLFSDIFFSFWPPWLFLACSTASSFFLFCLSCSDLQVRSFRRITVTLLLHPHRNCNRPTPGTGNVEDPFEDRQLRPRDRRHSVSRHNSLWRHWRPTSVTTRTSRWARSPRSQTRTRRRRSTRRTAARRLRNVRDVTILPGRWRHSLERASSLNLTSQSRQLLT